MRTPFYIFNEWIFRPIDRENHFSCIRSLGATNVTNCTSCTRVTCTCADCTIQVCTNWLRLGMYRIKDATPNDVLCPSKGNARTMLAWPERAPRPCRYDRHSKKTALFGRISAPFIGGDAEDAARNQDAAGRGIQLRKRRRPRIMRSGAAESMVGKCSGQRGGHALGPGAAGVA